MSAAGFLSTLSLRRATSSSYSAYLEEGISIHALLAESDRGGHISKARSKHFYPRSPCGERRSGLARLAPRLDFYPRSPCGERPGVIRKASSGTLFLSTLSLRRATLAGSTSASRMIFLSTLSLRRATVDLHGERHRLSRFLSTLSLRRAT